jgi:hypothetical protein
MMSPSSPFLSSSASSVISPKTLRVILAITGSFGFAWIRCVPMVAISKRRTSTFTALDVWTACDRRLAVAVAHPRGPEMLPDWRSLECR